MYNVTIRDESRHVLCGVKFLRDMVQQNPDLVDIIRNTISRWMPQMKETLHLPEPQRAALMFFGEDPDDVMHFGMNSLRKKLKVIGVSHEFYGKNVMPGQSELHGRSDLASHFYRVMLEDCLGRVGIEQVNISVINIQRGLATNMCI